jgi:hypothetical protein
LQPVSDSQWIRLTISELTGSIFCELLPTTVSNCFNQARKLPFWRRSKLLMLPRIRISVSCNTSSMLCGSTSQRRSQSKIKNV